MLVKYFWRCSISVLCKAVKLRCLRWTERALIAGRGDFHDYEEIDDNVVLNYHRAWEVVALLTIIPKLRTSQTTKLSVFLAEWKNSRNEWIVCLTNITSGN
eukprot:scaffold1389_cov251-Ochromonas_danica.AAC.23